MKEILFKALKFFGLSGIGWLIDVSIYMILSSIFHIDVSIANIVSSFTAVSFVFVTSTRKVFHNKSKIKLKYKYFIYQVLLIFVSSFALGCLKDWFLGFEIAWLTNYINIIVKILITPFTMILNYIVMSLLIEKI